MRRRGILFAGFVVRMEDTRLPKCVMFGELVGGAGYVEGEGKEWMECLLNKLRAFGINADQWTTAAQDDVEWRKTAKLLIAFDVQGRHCLTQMNDESLVLTRLLKDPQRKGKYRRRRRRSEGSCIFLRKCGVITLTGDSI